MATELKTQVFRHTFVAGYFLSITELPDEIYIQSPLDSGLVLKGRVVLIYIPHDPGGTLGSIQNIRICFPSHISIILKVKEKQRSCQITMESRIVIVLTGKGHL